MYCLFQNKNVLLWKIKIEKYYGGNFNVLRIDNLPLSDLLADWELAKAGEPLFKIDPLK
jgi:hypothetical protein